jgi:hypothetical protein
VSELEEGALITGMSGHEIFVIRHGMARWVPDAWTMCAEGLSPAHLVIVGDAELEQLPVGDPLPTAMPSPRLAPGTIVETESGVWRSEAGRLVRLSDPIAIQAVAFADDAPVVWLPDAVVRSLFTSQQEPG